MLGSDRLSSVHLIVKVMGSKRKEILLASGLIFVSFAFFDFLPAGPWLDASFSRGMSGLLGLSLIYLSWFEYIFDGFGVVPSINRWKQPESTWKTVTLSGIGILALSWISGNTMFGDALPEPSGMILILIGLLVTYSGLYAYLVTTGPLREEE